MASKNPEWWAKNWKRVSKAYRTIAIDLDNRLNISTFEAIRMIKLWYLRRNASQRAIKVWATRAKNAERELAQLRNERSDSAG